MTLEKMPLIGGLGCGSYLRTTMAVLSRFDSFVTLLRRMTWAEMCYSYMPVTGRFRTADLVVNAPHVVGFVRCCRECTPRSHKQPHGCEAIQASLRSQSSVEALLCIAVNPDLSPWLVR